MPEVMPMGSPPNRSSLMLVLQDFQDVFVQRLTNLQEQLERQHQEVIAKVELLGQVDKSATQPPELSALRCPPVPGERRATPPAAEKDFFFEGSFQPERSTSSVLFRHTVSTISADSEEAEELTSEGRRPPFEEMLTQDMIPDHIINQSGAHRPAHQLFAGDSTEGLVTDQIVKRSGAHNLACELFTKDPTEGMVTVGSGAHNTAKEKSSGDYSDATAVERTSWCLQSSQTRASREEVALSWPSQPAIAIKWPQHSAALDSTSSALFSQQHSMSSSVAASAQYIRHSSAEDGTKSVAFAAKSTIGSQKSARSSQESVDTEVTEYDTEKEVSALMSADLKEENAFTLHQCFIHAPAASPRRHQQSPKYNWAATASMLPESEGAESTIKSCVGDVQMYDDGLSKFCMVRPNSTSRMTWDLVGSLLVLYDSIVLPLQTFDIPHDPAWYVMAVIIACFWTLDILWSLRTGHYADGLLEMRPTRIMQQYFKKDFPFDILLVVLDWAFVIELSGNGGGKDVGSGFSFGKWMRILRLSCLARLVKLARVSRTINDSVTSEVLLAVVRVMRLVLVIMFLNHYVACAWYALGTIEENAKHWVFGNKIHDAPLSYQYLTSLHWSLTQFTPASMEIFPTNEKERLFNIGAVVFGLITFSSFISALTAAMANLASVRGHRVREESQLRSFLSDRKISVELGMNIRRYFHDNYEVRKNRVNEIDIAFFADIPPFLLVELHAEIYMPTLCWHPVFKCYAAFDSETIKKICHFAVEQRAQRHGENVFLNRTPATEMSFILSGELAYNCRWAIRPDRCMPGQWLCEAVLWGTWIHRGRLSVQVSSELAVVNANIFCSIASERFQSFQSLRTYAQEFAKLVTSSDQTCTPLTDMPVSIDTLHQMVGNAFSGRSSLLENILHRRHSSANYLEALLPFPRMSSRRSASRMSG